MKSGVKNDAIKLPAYGTTLVKIEINNVNRPKTIDLPSIFQNLPLTIALLAFNASPIFILLSRTNQTENEYHIPKMIAGIISKTNPKRTIKPTTKDITKNFTIFENPDLKTSFSV